MKIPNMRHGANLLTLLAGFVFAFVFAQALCAASPAKGGAQAAKVVLVVIPTLSLEDLSGGDMPNLHGLAGTSSVGLMNARTAGINDSDPGSFTDDMYTPESGYVTLGAGARAVAGFDARKCYNREELVDGASAGMVLKRLTLIDPKSSEVVQPNIASLIRDVSLLSYTLSPGELGTALHAAGLKTAAVGNSDAETRHREIATIAMDKDGLVDFGDVGPSMVTPDPTAPLGARTNVSRLLAEAQRCLKLADFTAIELGDPARLERSRLDLMDGVYQNQRKRIMRETDQIFGRLLNLVDLKGTILVVLTPYPQSFALEKTGNSLCPVLVAGEQYTEGLLTSGSTRVPGIVTSVDIAPSILDWLHAPATLDLVGRTVETKSGTLNQLVETQRRATAQNRIDRVLRQSAVATIVLVVMITLLWFLLPAEGRIRKKVFPLAILFPVAFAPAMVALGAATITSVSIAWIALIAVSAAIVAVSLAIGRTPIRALMLICLAVSAALCVDAGFGGPLTKYSIMSYSIMEGARYYGMGNEYMGTFLGASIVGMGLLLSSLNASVRTVRIALVCGMVVETAAIGSPELGANVGGAVAVLFSFGFALAATSEEPLSFRRVGGIVLGVAVVLAIMTVLDSLRGHQHESHLGRAVSLIRAGGLAQAGMIIKRKMAMNILLTVSSAWGRLVAVFAISSVVALKWKDVARRLRPISMHARVILAGTISGALVAWFFNDSGVVAAGTSFIYTWALILLAANASSDRQVTSGE
jgi:hypothetical protein